MTLHLTTPGELIAAIPGLIGFEPRDSLVLVGIGAGGIVAPLMRVDLAACATRRRAEDLARECVALLSDTRALSVVLVAYADAGGPEALGRVREPLDRGIDVADAWVVSGGRFWAPACDDAACCPPGGRQVPAPLAPDAGGGAEPRRASRARSGRGRPKPRRGVAGRRGRAGHPGTDVRLASLEAWREAVREAGKGVPPPVATCRRLGEALRDVWTRDAIVVDLVPGEAATAEALCGADASAGVRDALDRLLGASDPAVPEPDAVRATLTVCDAIAEHCQGAASAAHGLAAIVRWWSGDDRGASASVRASLDAEPGYRLAELVGCALAVDMAPGWMRVV